MATKYYALVKNDDVKKPFMEYQGDFGNSEEAWEYFEKVHGQDDVYAVNTFSTEKMKQKVA